MTNDKILNTRISQQLYDKISAKAKKNRTSISHLIRNLVEDALEIHEDFHDAVDKKIRKYLAESETGAIIGFQEITLAKDIICDDCNMNVPPTRRAHVAFFEDRNLKAVVCESCKLKNSTQSPHEISADC